jgi:hypothetical protein
MSQPDLFGNVVDEPGGYRATDPATSREAALRPFNRTSSRALLLATYGRCHDGLIDEEAGLLSGVQSRCPWKRCSELRAHGLIEPTGDVRMSTAGANQQVCRITFAGRRMLGLIDSGPS